jgi:hypothetical protein
MLPVSVRIYENDLFVLFSAQCKILFFFRNNSFHPAHVIPARAVSYHKMQFELFFKKKWYYLAAHFRMQS